MFINKIKKCIINLQDQKNQEVKNENINNKWIEEFKKHRNIMTLDRVVLTELIDYIEIHENKKITIHFKFSDYYNS